jgi:predicted nucleotidyltransferase
MNLLAVKPTRRRDFKEVVYDSARWALLEELREKAAWIMSALEGFRLRSLVHGSVARGDVNRNSDVDVFVLKPQSSFLVETALEKAGVPVARRLLVQATPNYAVKAYIEVDEGTSVSFPLMHMRGVEREFYRFGGEVNLQGLHAGVRVVGVDKRLMLIEPASEGHVESGVVGCEGVVARRLGVSVETVLDRVRALLKRDEVGRTGVFVKRELVAEETFELVLKRLADENPAVRRRLR